MTPKQAQAIIGNPARVFVVNMAHALALHSWNNSEDDWKRLEAACVVLGNRAPARSRVILEAHKASGARPKLPNPFGG